MKFAKFAQWLGFVILLLAVSVLSATIALKISREQEQRETATQQAAATQQVLQLHIEQTQTAEALERERANFSKNISLSAHLEDCIASDNCNVWAKKVLVIYVVNTNNKNIHVEWNLTSLACSEHSSDELNSNGGSETFRCTAYERPRIDSIDYIRKACMTFTASIISTDDTQAQICSDVANIPDL